MLHFRMDMPLYLMALYGSILILVVYLLRSFLKNRLPKFVFPLMWVLVLVRLLVPFSLSSPISLPLPNWQTDFTISSALNTLNPFVEYTTLIPDSISIVPPVAAVEAYVVPGLNWMLILIIIFSIGLVFTASVLLYQKWCYSKKLKNSLLLEHNETINTLLREMNMGHVLLFTNDEIASPLVCGLLNPHIYLPTRMDFQNTQLLRHILSHETMHIKHRDNWLKAIMLIAICLHWYNPLVWLMSKWLSSDLESSCDAAVLKQSETSERQNYAYSLLAMAITGNRSTLLYSAFSKTEVERRIKNILHYKKATAITLAISILLISCSVITFATCIQAPFSTHLSSYCASDNCRWGARATLARDIKLGEHPQKRADNIILDVLSDNANDPSVIRDKIQIALSNEFDVEKGAFQVLVSLCLSEEDIASEYKGHGLIKGQDGLYLYNEKKVRVYTDEMLDTMQTQQDGIVDVSVVRDSLGKITSIKTSSKGDKEFDLRTKEIMRNNSYLIEDSRGITIKEGSVSIFQNAIDI